jgi:hypothetical protein
MGAVHGQEISEKYVAKICRGPRHLLQHRSDIKLRFQTSRLGVRTISENEIMSRARGTCGAVRQISIHLFMQHIGAGGGQVGMLRVKGHGRWGFSVRLTGPQLDLMNESTVCRPSDANNTKRVSELQAGKNVAK